MKAGDLGPVGRDRRPRFGWWSALWRGFLGSLAGRPWTISPGRVMLLAVALLLSYLIVKPFAAGVAGSLAWAGLVLFIVGYALFFIRPPGSKMEKRWRGRVLDDDDSWWDRLRKRAR